MVREMWRRAVEGESKGTLEDGRNENEGSDARVFMVVSCVLSCREGKEW